MTPAEALCALARTPHLLVALDFDGTLAPLVDEPMSARMTAASRHAVEALLAAPATTVAFVSGRALKDLRVIAEHGDDSPVLLAGSHGAEQWPVAAASDPDPRDHTGPAEDQQVLARMREAATTLAHEVSGAWIESKDVGFALHTRQADPRRAAALQDQLDAMMAEHAPHWRRRTGRDILEYSFRHEGKDDAVARLRALAGATAVLFAGDDVTDEDALASLGPRDVGVRVGAGETAASLRVEGIPELAALLVALAHERTRWRE